MRVLDLVLTALIVTGTCFPAHAMDDHVSPSGSDDAPGPEQQPFATIGKACSVVRPGDTCHLRAGVYREVLRPTRSGEAGKHIVFTRYRDERAIVSGADPIDHWQREPAGI